LLKAVRGIEELAKPFSMTAPGNPAECLGEENPGLAILREILRTELRVAEQVGHGGMLQLESVVATRRLHYDESRDLLYSLKFG
jgi:hypothetical protein